MRSAPAARLAAGSRVPCWWVWVTALQEVSGCADGAARLVIA